MYVTHINIYVCVTICKNQVEMSSSNSALDFDANALFLNIIVFFFNYLHQSKSSSKFYLSEISLTKDLVPLLLIIYCSLSGYFVCNSCLKLGDVIKRK